MATGRWEEWEIAYLEANYMALSDKEIADKIGRKPPGIYKKRRELGLKKTAAGAVKNKDKISAKEMTNDYILAQMPKAERVKFYKRHFEKSWRYKFIKKIVLDNEMEYYKHRYIDIVDSLDSITYIEEDLVHNLVMTDIQVLRIQESIRNELHAYQNAADDDENIRPPAQYLYKDLNEVKKTYVNFQEKLAVTRQQRLKENREEEQNIASIIDEFLDKRNREDADRLAGELDFHARKCSTEMSKMDFLMGGDDIFSEDKKKK